MALTNTQGLVDRAMGSSNEQEYQNLSKGTDTSGLLNQGDNLNQNLSFGDNALSSAIRSKYSKPFQVQQQGLQNKMQLDAKNTHFEKLLTAQQMASQEVQLNFQKEMIKYKQKMAKRQQRQQLVGSVLGLTGAVAGGVMGGPAGAVGGSAAGGAAGQAVAGG